MSRPLLAVLAMTMLVAPAAKAAPLCDPGAIEIHAESGPQTFSIEIAATPVEQARGLMFRPAMPEDAGMLFIFEPPRPASFWMQNTMIPLDMIFIDDTGRVESIAERNDTYSQRASSSAGDVRAVLEINGGLSRELGIVPGTQVAHEAFKSAPEGFACPN
jgi:uncharacterized membrane protein (UPF0127 family)